MLLQPPLGHIRKGDRVFSLLYGWGDVVARNGFLITVMYAPEHPALPAKLMSVTTDGVECVRDIRLDVRTVFPYEVEVVPVVEKRGLAVGGVVAEGAEKGFGMHAGVEEDDSNSSSEVGVVAAGSGVVHKTAVVHSVGVVAIGGSPRKEKKEVSQAKQINQLSLFSMGDVAGRYHAYRR